MPRLSGARGRSGSVARGGGSGAAGRWRAAVHAAQRVGGAQGCVGRRVHPAASAAGPRLAAWNSQATSLGDSGAIPLHDT